MQVRCSGFHSNESISPKLFNLQKPEISSHLFCWHEFKVNKIFTIGPLKMEFLSRNPDVVQAHDVLSHAEVMEMRTSILGTSSNERAQQIEQKLGALSGLRTHHGSDAVQVTEHLPGEDSETHMDFVTQMTKKFD